MTQINPQGNEAAFGDNIAGVAGTITKVAADDAINFTSEPFPYWGGLVYAIDIDRTAGTAPTDARLQFFLAGEWREPQSTGGANFNENGMWVAISPATGALQYPVQARVAMTINTNFAGSITYEFRT